MFLKILLDKIKQIIESRYFTLIFSFSLSYIIWSNLILFVPTTKALNIPICYYNKLDSNIIESPSEISISISGPKKIIKDLIKSNLAAHINLADLKIGENYLAITEDNLMLPNNISLNSIFPNNILIKLQKI